MQLDLRLSQTGFLGGGHIHGLLRSLTEKTERRKKKEISQRAHLSRFCFNNQVAHTIQKILACDSRL